MSVNLAEVLPSYLWSDILSDLKLEELTGLTKVSFILRDIILSDVKLNRILTEEKSIRVRAQQSLNLWKKFNITRVGDSNLTLEFIENSIKEIRRGHRDLSFAPIGIEIFKAPQLGDNSLIPTALKDTWLYYKEIQDDDSLNSADIEDIWSYDEEVPNLYQFKYAKEEDPRIIKYDNKYISLAKMLKGYVPSDEYHARILQHFGVLVYYFKELPEIKDMKIKYVDVALIYQRVTLKLYEARRRDQDLYQRIIDVYKEDGYEFHYYGFFKSDYPGLLARKPVEKGGWELTPENFEKYNSYRFTNKDEEIYNYILSDKYNTSNAKRELARISGYVPRGLHTNLLGWSSRKVAMAILGKMKQSSINYKASEYINVSNLREMLEYSKQSVSVTELHLIIDNYARTEAIQYLTTEYLNFSITKKLLGIVASRHRKARVCGTYGKLITIMYSGLRIYKERYSHSYIDFVYRHMFQTWNHVDLSIYCRQVQPFNLELSNLEDVRFTIDTIGRPIFDLRHLAKNILGLDINGLNFSQICQTIEQKLS